jgi:hypothetical protein
MDPVADILDSRPLAHADRVKKIWVGTSLLCVDFHKTKVIPHAINEVIQVKVHLATYDNCVVVMGQTVHGLETDGVDFVVDIEAWYVLPRSYQDVDELICSDIFPDHYIAIV